MKLVVDIEKTISNNDSLNNSILEYVSSFNKFKGGEISSKLSEINNCINNFIENISNDLDKISTSSKEFNNLITECMTEYSNNEKNTKVISADAIANIIEKNPGLVDGSYKNETSTIDELLKSDTNSTAGYKFSDVLGLLGIFTRSDGTKFFVYNQGEVYKNKKKFGIDWSDDRKCTRASIASIISPYSGKSMEENIASVGPASWRDDSMFNQFERLTNGKLRGERRKYNTDTLRETMKNGGMAMVYVKGGKGADGFIWSHESHAMALLDYRVKDGQEQVFLSTTNPKKGFTPEQYWTRLDEFSTCSAYGDYIAVSVKA